MKIGILVSGMPFSLALLLRVKLLLFMQGMIVIKKSVYIFALHLAYGGVEKAVSLFANLLCDDYDVHIISVYNMPDSPAYEISDKVDIEYLLDDVPNRKEFKAAVRSRNVPEILKEGFGAVRILCMKKSSVIRALRKIESGVIVTTRDEDAVLASAFGRPGTLKIAQLHHDHAFKGRYIRHFRHNYNNIDIFTLLSPKMADEVSQILGNRRKPNVLYVPNFIETVSAAPDLSEKEKTVLAVGRLDPIKGFDRLIESFCRVHDEAGDWKLVIAGDGNEYDKLKALIEELHAGEYISLTGRLTPDEVVSRMQRAGIYALSSYSEGFPFVLLEAMCGALPIVAYDIRSGLDMIVEDGETGFLVSECGQFESRLLELMGDEKLRERMSINAYEKTKEFSSGKLRETWRNIIEGNINDQQ